MIIREGALKLLCESALAARTLAEKLSLGEAPNNPAFCAEPAQLRDAVARKIKGFSPFPQAQKFAGLVDQHLVIDHHQKNGDR
jgi:hypothetical protein